MLPGLVQDPQRNCAPLRLSRLDQPPPTSNPCYASCHLRHDLLRKPASTSQDHAAADMIAPTARGCKRAVAEMHKFTSEIGRHGIVSGIIIPPNFRQASAYLDCEKKPLRWPGPFGSGFLSPQPPGVVGIGPVRRGVNPHYWANESWSFFFLGCVDFSTSICGNARVNSVILRSALLRASRRMAAGACGRSFEARRCAASTSG